jgi:hypothetical protein
MCNNFCKHVNSPVHAMADYERGENSLEEQKKSAYVKTNTLALVLTEQLQRNSCMLLAPFAFDRLLPYLIPKPRSQE